LPYISRVSSPTRRAVSRGKPRSSGSRGAARGQPASDHRSCPLGKPRCLWPDRQGKNCLIPRGARQEWDEIVPTSAHAQVQLKARRCDPVSAAGRAFRLVQLALRFQSDVRVFWNGRVADGKSILDLLMLGAGSGALVELEVIGPDSEEAAAALCELVENRFHDHSDGRDLTPEP